ncbi:putative ras-related protein RABA1f-like [Capsicum annuum]|nr:putative ras-related protein RABA1f-like [Capsicum annuum]
MEKAQKLRSTLTKEMLSGSTSTNILAMTFRQVTLQHLWNFELVLFIPGAERNMDDLETPREENQGILSLAWRYSGVLPMYLKHAMDSKDSDLNSSSMPSEGTEDEMKAAAQDIASYQVVLSREGKIVEFQPTSRVAEYQWAANPLVKELYEKKIFVPDKYNIHTSCLIERGLKMITRPNDDVVLELLLSSNPQSSFAFLASLLQSSVVEEQPLFSGIDAKVALLKRKRDKYTLEL